MNIWGLKTAGGLLLAGTLIAGTLPAVAQETAPAPQDGAAVQGTAPDVAATDQPSAPEAQQSVPDADEPAESRETAPAGPASPESTEPSDDAAAGDAETGSPADEQRLADELAREHGARMGQGLDRLRETGDPQEPTDAELSRAQALIDGVATPYSAANGGAARSVADPLATWRPKFGVQGMDVSSHQPSVNWAQQYSAGARFAYVKATEGDSYRNPLFTDQYNGASNAGMFRGAYHFAIPTPNSSGAAQANYFINNGGGWTADGRTLPPLLDIEYNPYSQYGNTCYNFTPAQMVNGMGGTTLIELYIVYRALHRFLEGRGITITRRMIGDYITSLEMAGCSITLLRLDDDLTRLWDAPVDTPGLRWGA